MRPVLSVLAGAAVLVLALLVGTQLRASREPVAEAAATASPSGMASAPASPARTPEIATARASVSPTAGGPPVVSGRVTAGGRPVRNAEIRVYPAGSSIGPTPVPPESGKAITDAAGVYRVALPPGTYRIGAYLASNAPELADGYWLATWFGNVYAIGLAKDVVVTGGIDGLDIAMVHTVTIAGRVVGRDGVGVPNAEVTTRFRSGGIDFEAGSVTKTDASGAFSGRVVPLKLQLIAAAAGRTQTASSVVDLDLAGDRTDITVTLDRGNVVTGVLRDAQGKPLASTGFGVHPTDPQISCYYSCNATTDAAGRFAVTLPNATVYFATWQDRPGAPLYRSKDITISSDLTVDPVLVIQ